MSRKIFGMISDSLSGGQPVQGLRVMAWDEDWPGGDDYMGRAYTDQQGKYLIRYAEGLWDAGLSSGRPDIYITLEIKTPAINGSTSANRRSSGTTTFHRTCRLTCRSA